MGKIERLNKVDIDLIAKDLKKGNSKQKKTAVIKIGKYRIYELSSLLFNFYNDLNKTNKNWEMQKEMIKSLGRVQEKKMIPFLQDIVDKNEYEDMITIEATKALLRIKNTDSEDIVKNVFNLLKIGNKSVKDGAIFFLSCENVSVKEDEMKKIIKLVDNDDEFDEDLDFREYLISAMSSWPKKISKPYFEKYRGDNRINQDVIKYAEKGKCYHLDY